MAILDGFSVFSQHLSCRHAVYCVRNVVESYVNNGSTVSMCARDRRKAFDRMNHYALFIKLMERTFPSELLSIGLLETWFRLSASCVRWGTSCSIFFSSSAGVRQRGVFITLFICLGIYFVSGRPLKLCLLQCQIWVFFGHSMRSMAKLDVYLRLRYSSLCRLMQSLLGLQHHEQYRPGIQQTTTWHRDILLGWQTDRALGRL